jgi:hypothetical protein
MARAPLVLALLVLAAALAGCTGVTGGREVTTTPDHFQYKGGGVINGTEEFAWENSKSKATVTYQGGGTGSLTLTLLDAAGKQVYQKGVRGTGGQTFTDTTAEGQPGTWTIRVHFEGVSGGMDLRVDAA